MNDAAKRAQGRLSDRQEEPEPAVPSGGARGRLHLRLRPGRQGRRRQHDRPARSRRRPRGTIESIRRILAEEGATLADVVRVTTYLEDTRDFGRYNKVFAEHFKDAVLARTTVEARAVINTKIEMDAIAYKPQGRMSAWRR